MNRDFALVLLLVLTAVLLAVPVGAWLAQGGRVGIVWAVTLTALTVGVTYLVWQRRVARRRTAGLRAFLSAVRRATLHAVSRAGLLDQVCKEAVRHPELRAACVGLLMPDHEHVRIVAASGLPETQWAALRLPLDAEPRVLVAPSLQAIAQGQPVTCHNLRQLAVGDPVRSLARTSGLVSALSLPLMECGRCVGALSLYAGRAGYFDAGAVGLLQEVGGELSFALDRFSRESRRKKAEEQFRETSEQLAAVFQAAPLAVLVLDLDGRVRLWNPAAERIFGWRAEEVLGRPLPVVPAEGQEQFDALRMRVAAGEALTGLEIRRQHRDGTPVDLSLSCAPLSDGDGRVTAVLALLMDVSRSKRAEARVEYLAYHDALTGLPNRLLLMDRLVQALRAARRADGHVALLFLDLDRFKVVNDSLGHSVGDQLLQAVARRVAGCLQEGETLSRLGGDEFAVLLPELAEVEDAARVAEKLLGALGAPFVVQGHTLGVSTSIGISVAPDDGEEGVLLLRNGEAAMYHAKQAGRSTFQFFAERMNAEAVDRLHLENSLRTAVVEGQLRLHYQPQVDARTGAVCGLEALLRWQHPQWGLVSPARFIPVAEESGLIVPVGAWVLHEACRCNAAWQKAGLRRVPVAVNLSAVQFRQRDLDQLIRGALQDSGLAPRYLELELTESVLLRETEAAVDTIHRLKGLGMQLAIDDFGTGYSSLSYLKRLAVDKLKIDQAFVRRLPEDADDAAISTAIISMAHSLGIRVLAEGVETTGQVEFLREHGCDELQGYHFGRPVPAELIPALLGKAPASTTLRLRA